MSYEPGADRADMPVTTMVINTNGMNNAEDFSIKGIILASGCEILLKSEVSCSSNTPGVFISFYIQIRFSQWQLQEWSGPSVTFTTLKLPFCLPAIFLFNHCYVGIVQLFTLKLLFI